MSPLCLLQKASDLDRRTAISDPPSLTGAEAFADDDPCTGGAAGGLMVCHSGGRDLEALFSAVVKTQQHDAAHVAGVAPSGRWGKDLTDAAVAVVHIEVPVAGLRGRAAGDQQQ